MDLFTWCICAQHFGRTDGYDIPVCLYAREGEDGGGEEILSVVHVGEGMEGMNASLPPPQAEALDVHREKEGLCTCTPRTSMEVMA